MPTISDVEFGEITVRRSSLARYVRVKIGQNGELSASLPKRASLKLVMQLIEQSRDELRSVVSQHRSTRKMYVDGDEIGKSHMLVIVNKDIKIPTYRLTKQIVEVSLPLAMYAESSTAQKVIREVVKRTLTKEAKAFLPRRVKFLADTHKFDIATVRFNNAKTRWGSCSSANSINLNIALMQLSHELIDYVIIHELCHTRHMDHSKDFWSLVESLCPDYKALRNALKSHHAYI